MMGWGKMPHWGKMPQYAIATCNPFATHISIMLHGQEGGRGRVRAVGGEPGITETFWRLTIYSQKSHKYFS